jgi:hypothetical protein
VRQAQKGKAISSVAIHPDDPETGSSADAVLDRDCFLIDWQPIDSKEGMKNENGRTQEDGSVYAGTALPYR